MSLFGFVLRFSAKAGALSACLLRCTMVSACHFHSHIGSALNKVWAKVGTAQADGKMTITLRVWFVSKQHTWFQSVNTQNTRIPVPTQRMTPSIFQLGTSETKQTIWRLQTQEVWCIRFHLLERLQIYSYFTLRPPNTNAGEYYLKRAIIAGKMSGSSHWKPPFF